MKNSLENVENITVRHKTKANGITVSEKAFVFVVNSDSFYIFYEELFRVSAVDAYKSRELEVMTRSMASTATTLQLWLPRNSYL